SGCRLKRMGATIERHWYRHYFGRVFATGASLVLGLPIYDTQCGAKLLRAELAGILFERPFISRWLFDIELLARMIQLLGRKKVMTSVVELPLERWEDKGESKVKLLYIPKVPFELLLIGLTYRKYLYKK
ncbi:MAG: glycosyltransferase family 2 protein, partial [Candidatus Aminicenantales bacterium]